MKTLNNKETEIAASIPNTERIIEKQANRIAFLESWLCSVLIRDDNKRLVDITHNLNKIKLINTDTVTYYVLNNYDRKFFSNECDTQFKIELAQAILDYMVLIFPHYRNELLESIAQNKSEYADNFIFVEKL